MSKINLYKIAAKKRFLYDLPGTGQVNTTDLFKLSLPALDAIAIAIDETLDASSRKSFIGTPSEASLDVERKLEIVKDVIADKLAAKEAADKAAETRARKARIREAIARKEEEAIDDLSLEELKAALDD